MMGAHRLRGAALPLACIAAFCIAGCQRQTVDTSRPSSAAPLVVAGTMYLVTPFPNILYALDLTKPGAPAKWAYDPKPLGASKGVACCDLVNRGAAFANGSIFFNTLDGRTV